MQQDIDSILTEIKMLRKEVVKLSSLAGPFGVYLGDGTVLTQMADGLRFYVYSNDIILLPKMIGNRIWEPSVTRHLNRTISPDMNFIDVGANIGYFSCLAASKIDRQKAKVIAFEPNPLASKLLHRNVSINWSLADIEVHEKACASSKGLAELYVPDHHMAHASLFDMSNTNDPTYTSDRIETVTISKCRLDDVIEEKGRVGTIKIDVEGGEYGVLDGAREIIAASNSCQIIMEWSQSQLHLADHGRQDLLDFFDDNNLQVREIGKSDDPMLTPDELTKIEYANLFLLRE